MFCVISQGTNPVKLPRLLIPQFLFSWFLAAACPGLFGLPHAVAQSPSTEDTPATLTDTTGIRLQLITAGSVKLGSPQSAAVSQPEEQPQHEVAIAHDFYIGVTEITQKQWYTVMGTRPWRTSWNTPRLYVTEGDNYPATWITWPEARAFCDRLSKTETVAYRLPTEAEWEHACRNGSAAAWSFGDDATVAAGNGWFRENTVTDMYSLRPREVGGKAANSAGLLDMHGNVAEWCLDRFQTYPLESTSQLPTTLGVLRGGSWFVSHDHSRSATRDRLRIRRRLGSAGLRVVRELPGKEAPAAPPANPAAEATAPSPTPVAEPAPSAGSQAAPNAPPVNSPHSNASQPQSSATPPSARIMTPNCCTPVPMDTQHCVPAGPFLRGPRCRIPLIPVLW